MSKLKAGRSNKVLLVVPTFVSYHCFLRELSEVLVQRGWQVAVACDLSVQMGQERDPDREKGIAFFHISFPRGFHALGYLLCTLALRRILKEVRPDIVHAHFSAAILPVALLPRSRSRQAIGTFQGLQFPLSNGLKRRLLRRAETFSSRRLHWAWVLTRDDLAALKEAGVENARVQKGWGFGCRTDWFDPVKFSEKNRLQLRERWNIPDRVPVFAFVGRNVDFKGFAIVIRGFFRLLKTHPDARLLIIGDRDPLHPTGLTADEESRMQECPAIVRCGWQREVAPFLAITDALVHPSSREGMPVGCMEAIAMGVRLIAPASRGLRELLALTGETPLREISSEVVAEAMERVCVEETKPAHADPKKFSAIREQLDRYTYVEEQIRIYERLLGR